MIKMKVSGFTFVRNGVKFDYPFKESIKSILPLVDEMIVNVPSSEDDTLEAVKGMNEKKIKIFQTDWEGDIPSGGKILSHHTNLALEKCTGDWCFYIQADEIVHEEDHSKILDAMKNNLNDKNIDGLLFDYVHFYGSYDCVASARNWYRREVRIIRNKKNIVSFADAQGFRYAVNNAKIPVAYTGAKIYHYGWVRPIESMRTKTIAMDRLWHGDKKDEENKNLEYKDNQYGLYKFTGKHPNIMKKRIQSQNWSFNYSSKISSYREFRYWLSDFFQKLTGLRLFEYKGYRLKKKAYKNH
jgi:glycosyltransferase involved in cell wall biosynthesis